MAVNEIMRIKRKIIELESIMSFYDLQYEKYKLEQNLKQIERLGKIIKFDVKQNETEDLKSAIFSLKKFISKVESTEEYEKELGDVKNENI